MKEWKERWEKMKKYWEKRKKSGKPGFPGGPWGKFARRKGASKFSNLEARLDKLIREVEALRRDVRKLAAKGSSKKPGFGPKFGPPGKFGKSKGPWGKFGKFDPKKMKEWKERWERMKKDWEKRKKSGKSGSGKKFGPRGPWGRFGKFDPEKMKEWKERWEKMKKYWEKRKKSGKPGFPGGPKRGRKGRRDFGRPSVDIEAKEQPHQGLQGGVEKSKAIRSEEKK